MSLSVESNEANESAERNSTKKLVFWMGNAIDPREEDYVGDVTIKNGSVVFHGKSRDDYNFLTRKIGDMWWPQLGIPRFRKTASGSYEKDAAGKVIIGDYVFPGSATADEVLLAMHEYNQILGVTGSRLEDL